jgi:hypothetical protein
MKHHRWLSFLTAFAIIMSVTSPVTAQEKTGNKPGFALRPGTTRIVLMRPTVSVGEQSTGGMFEPNADWTAQARENLAKALRDAQGGLGNQVIDFQEGVTGEGALVTQYEKLFSALAGSVIEYQFFRGNRLPTKVRKDAGFEWSLGLGLNKLKSLEGADYALFITTRDAIGSTGRKVLQVVALLGGISVTSGSHIGYAGLIDLRTGDLVWLNADQEMGGDVRTADGAEKRVKQLLEGFPGRTDVAAALR